MNSVLKPAAAWPFPTSHRPAAVAPAPVAAAPASEGLFVTVPETTLPGGLVVPAFQVAQYLCGTQSNGPVVVDASATPCVNVNYQQARTLCENAGFKLITETQYLAIAHNIAQQDGNWSGGKVGEGVLCQGLHKGSVRGAQPGTYESTDPAERRWHELSTGARLYDFAGNVYTWVFDDVQGDAQGIVASKFSVISPSITTAPYPSMVNGMGWQPKAGSDWSGHALIRGGCWCSVDSAGVFRLDLGWPGDGGDSVGIRCTKPVGL